MINFYSCELFQEKKNAIKDKKRDEKVFVGLIVDRSKTRELE